MRQNFIWNKLFTRHFAAQLAIVFFKCRENLLDRFDVSKLKDLPLSPIVFSGVSIKMFHPVLCKSMQIEIQIKPQRINKLS